MWSRHTGKKIFFIPNALVIFIPINVYVFTKIVFLLESFNTYFTFNTYYYCSKQSEHIFRKSVTDKCINLFLSKIRLTIKKEINLYLILFLILKSLNNMHFCATSNRKDPFSKLLHKMWWDRKTKFLWWA